MAAERKKIFVVDDNATNLVACKNILKPYFEVYPAQSAVKLFEMLAWAHPDLILLDVEMPDMNGYETMQLLKDNDDYSEVPIILLTSKHDEESFLEGLNLGAVDYVSKPCIGPLLLRRINTHLSLVDCKNEIKLQNQTIEKMLQMDPDQT